MLNVQKAIKEQKRDNSLPQIENELNALAALIAEVQVDFSALKAEVSSLENLPGCCLL